MRKTRQENPSTEPLESLFEAILALEDKRECQRFLNDLCTPTEIRALSDRWWAARLVHQGKMSYREITKITKVSVTTVGRVARFLDQGYGGYRLILERLSQK